MFWIKFKCKEGNFRMYCFIMCIPLAPKNTYFQRTSLREVRRSKTLKEMTLPVYLRLALHENIPTQNGYS